MDIVTAQDIIRIAIEARKPVIGTGEPGTGKTAWAMTLDGTGCIDAPKGHKVIQVIGSVRDPADIGGWPMRTDDGIVLEPPYWAKYASMLALDGYHVIIVWDELRTVTAPQQAALLKVIHENRVGDMEMPLTISHCAFANSVEDSAGGVPLEPPMSNRFVHVPWVPSVTKWVKDMTLNVYAPQGYLPEYALAKLPQMRVEVATYINHRQENLQVLPKEEDKRDGPYPTCRTWDYSAHLWAVTNDQTWGWREQLLATCVGEEMAADFVNWRISLDLLSPEDILSGNFEVDGKVLVDLERPDRTFAQIANVMSYMSTSEDKDDLKGAWKALGHCAEKGAADIAASYLSDLFKIGDEKLKVDFEFYSKNVVPYLTKFREVLGDVDITMKGIG